MDLGCQAQFFVSSELGWRQCDSARTGRCYGHVINYQRKTRQVVVVTKVMKLIPLSERMDLMASGRWHGLRTFVRTNDRRPRYRTLIAFNEMRGPWHRRSSVTTTSVRTALRAARSGRSTIPKRVRGWRWFASDDKVVVFVTSSAGQSLLLSPRCRWR